MSTAVEQVEPGGLLSPDQYMDLLLARQAAYVTEHPPARPWILPPLEWFVREGDEALIDMAAIDASNKAPARSIAAKPDRDPRPRVYRSAASLRGERAELVARRDACAQVGLPDRAAAGGEGIGVRRGRRYLKRMDNALRRYAVLDQRVKTLDSRIARAEAREAKAAALILPTEKENGPDQSHIPGRLIGASTESRMPHE